MAGTDKPAPKAEEPAAEAPKTTSSASGPESAAMTGRISLTIDAQSGQMLMVEAVDDAGERRELTTAEKVALAKAGSKETLEDILEKTFEAGITAVLGEDAGEEEVESEEGAKLRRLILRPMIARSAAKRYMKREFLNKTVLGALIQDLTALDASDAEAVAAPTRHINPSSSSRRPTSPPRGARH